MIRSKGPGALAGATGAGNAFQAKAAGSQTIATGDAAGNSLAARLLCPSVLAGIDLASCQVGVSKAAALAAKIEQHSSLTEAEARNLAELLLRSWP